MDLLDYVGGSWMSMLIQTGERGEGGVDMGDMDMDVTSYPTIREYRGIIGINYNRYQEGDSSNNSNNLYEYMVDMQLHERRKSRRR